MSDRKNRQDHKARKHRQTEWGTIGAMQANIAEAAIARAAYALGRLKALVGRATPAARAGIALQVSVLAERIEGLCDSTEGFGLKESGQAVAADVTPQSAGTAAEGLAAAASPAASGG
jgi:hypothetical protein